MSSPVFGFVYNTGWLYYPLHRVFLRSLLSLAFSLLFVSFLFSCAALVRPGTWHVIPVWLWSHGNPSTYVPNAGIAGAHYQPLLASLFSTRKNRTQMLLRSIKSQVVLTEVGVSRGGSWESGQVWVGYTPGLTGAASWACLKILHVLVCPLVSGVWCHTLLSVWHRDWSCPCWGIRIGHLSCKDCPRASLLLTAPGEATCSWEGVIYPYSSYGPWPHLLHLEQIILI